MRRLKHGAALMMLLRQEKHSPMSLHEQVLSLICADGGFFTDIPTGKIDEARRELFAFFEREYPAICIRIDHGKAYSGELKEDVLKAAKKFFDRFSQSSAVAGA